MVPVFRFPQPTGPCAIGTLTCHWVDADRREVFTSGPDDRRELVVQLWYPAKPDPSAPRALYVQDAGAIAPVARLLQLPESTFAQWTSLTTNAIEAAPLADDQSSYPVVIFLEGIKFGYRQHNTFQVEELVSHGYIVAAIDQPYVAATVLFPDGRRAAYDSRWNPPHSAFMDAHIPYLAHDASFTLDQLVVLNRADPAGILTGRLDLQRAGLIGMSLGAVVGGEACGLEPRLRAGLLMDAFMPAEVVQAGLRQPTMWITRDADTMRLERRRTGGWSEQDIHETLTTMRAVYERLPGGGYYVQVPGMSHADMTDVPALSPLASELGFSGPIGVQRAHQIVNAYSLAFFDRHLKGRPAALLDGPAAQYPEVQLEARRA
jgi:predicted dienelactone hydrolase